MKRFYPFLILCIGIFIGHAINGTTAQAQSNVRINEVGWSGTEASSNDEWIELYNPTGNPVSLAGWTIESADGGPSTIVLTGTIQAGGYYLLERTDDTTISNIPADKIYTGSLANGGETLTLEDNDTVVVDELLFATGWPAGTSSPERASMEWSSGWQTSIGGSGALDANGDPVIGTPRLPNSAGVPTATPTPSPTGPTPTPLPPTETPTPEPTVPPGQPHWDVVISEVNWMGSNASSTDEWIELHNPDPTGGINLDGWTLYSIDGGITIDLTGLSLPPSGFLLLERTDDNTVSDIPADMIYVGGLSNEDETLVLIDNTGQLQDYVDACGDDGCGWPAGSSNPKASMERRDDTQLEWDTNDGVTVNGLDADGNPLMATPRQANSNWGGGGGGTTGCHLLYAPIVQQQ